MSTSPATQAFRARWATGAELLAAIEQAYGRHATWRSQRAPWISHAACIACRSLPLRREAVYVGYPITVAGEGGGYAVDVACRCGATAADGLARYLAELDARAAAWA